MAEAVKVICRCRPMNDREKRLATPEIIGMDSAECQVMLSNPTASSEPPKSFTFDGAFFTDSQTETIYNDVCWDLVEGVLEGYNGTVFAYGQTGCGKSFTMQGIATPTQRGIIPRSFDHIFEAVAVTKEKQFLVHASYLEIYNEEIRDLLSRDTKKKLELKEHPDKGVYVQGLSMNEVQTNHDCQVLMGRGWNNRSTGYTLMNADSSRSHSIFTINIEMCQEGADNKEHFRAGKLNLVDLAGSERQSKTGSTGDRLKEATKINLSLSALGNVISALVDGKSKHIPYRDSKLTRLLQDSLGGNTKTLMVACISPAGDNYEETLSTLRYANRAKNIKNKPKINEDPKDALLREYKEEIELLKQMLVGKLPNQGLQESQQPVNSRRARRDSVLEEQAAIKSEYEQKMLAMQAQIEEVNRHKEILEAEVKALRENTRMQLSAVKEIEALGVAEDERITGQDNVSAICDDTQELNQPVPNEELPNVDMMPSAGDHLFPASSSMSPQPSLHEGSGPAKDVGAQGEHPKLFPIRRPKSAAPNLSALMESELDAAEEQEIEDNEEETSISVSSNDKDEVATKREEESGQTTGAAMEDETQLIAAPRLPDEEREKLTKEQEQAMKRLSELESLYETKVVKGGLQADDRRIVEKRAARKRHVEERQRQQLRKAAQSEDLDTVVMVYDNVMQDMQEQKKGKDKMIEKLKQAKLEVRDLQSEFESERCSYLDTIREQTRHIALLDAILNKMEPLIQRDCNYSNVRRIKEAASYDSDNALWKIPEIERLKTNLPNLGVESAGRGNHSNSGSSALLARRSKSPMEMANPQYRQTACEDQRDEGTSNNWRPKSTKSAVDKKQLGDYTNGTNGPSYSNSLHPVSHPTGYSSPATSGESIAPASSPPVSWERNPKSVKLEKLDLASQRANNDRRLLSGRKSKKHNAIVNETNINTYPVL